MNLKFILCLFAQIYLIHEVTLPQSVFCCRRKKILLLMSGSYYAY
jgi:hypothetical protein